MKMRVVRLSGTLMFAGLLLAVAGPAAASTYYIWDDWGGIWSDAEKSSDNTEDDLLCWAASSSNILEWTGWGLVGGMTNTDQMFQYFQDHWTDLGGNPYYAWDWWFDGTNDGPSDSNWAQVDVPGGGFWLGEDINDYRHFSDDDPTAMSTIDSWLHDGYGMTLSIGGAMAHSITCWGFDYSDLDGYLGVWVTDSDDDKGGAAPRPDSLRYYDVALSGGQWWLQDYYGASNSYITEVVALAAGPIIPEPTTMTLLGLGLAGIVLRRFRKRS